MSTWLLVSLFLVAFFEVMGKLDEWIRNWLFVRQYTTVREVDSEGNTVSIIYTRKGKP